MLKYRVLYELATNGELQKRLIAAAFLAHVPEPETWAYANRWQLAASPGWVDAYLAALPEIVQDSEQHAIPDLQNPAAYDPIYAITDEQIQEAVETLTQQQQQQQQDQGQAVESLETSHEQS